MTKARWRRSSKKSINTDEKLQIGLILQDETSIQVNAMRDAKIWKMYGRKIELIR